MNISEKEHAMHLAELGTIQQGFAKEGFHTELVEKSPEIPLHVLLLSLGQDDRGNDRTINLNFMPLPESDIESIRLLQLYAVIPCGIASGRREDVEKLLLTANGAVPLGHLGIKDDGEVYGRYVYSASSSRTVSSEELLEVVTLFHYMLDLFGKRIAQVAAGELSVAEALRSLE